MVWCAKEPIAKLSIMLVAIQGLIFLMLVSDEMGKPVQAPGEAGQAEVRTAGWQANGVAETYE